MFRLLDHVDMRVGNVDRIAARIAPFAHAYEAPHACTEYTQTYYATFFEDAEGNKLEVCYR